MTGPKLFIRFFLFIVLIFLIKGCYDDEFVLMNNQNEIVEIEIVEISEEYKLDVGWAPPKLTRVCVITEKEAFLEDFFALDGRPGVNDPTGVFCGEIVIKISYSNGDYELIEADGKGTYSHDKDWYTKHDGTFYFDRDEFDNFIAKYIELYTSS